MEFFVESMNLSNMLIGYWQLEKNPVFTDEGGE